MAIKETHATVEALEDDEAAINRILDTFAGPHYLSPPLSLSLSFPHLHHPLMLIIHIASNMITNSSFSIEGILDEADAQATRRGSHILNSLHGSKVKMMHTLPPSSPSPIR